jgi:uncharacterized oxidoreductase
MNLEGNTILITGGAGGIGFELAKEFLKRGNTVIVTGRDKPKLERAQRQLPKLQIIQSDVSRVEDIEALYSRVTKDFPKLNVIVNNAGVMRTVNLHNDEQSLDDLTREVDINFKGPVRMARRFLAHLKKMPNAAIVNVSSGLAFVPLPISPIYCATKAALHSFSLSLRSQLKKTQVKVFELAPPATATELLGDFSPSDLEGVSVMKVDEMVRLCLKGLEKDQLEIRPGQSNQLKFMNRLAPAFILAQLSKPVDRMLEETA